MIKRPFDVVDAKELECKWCRTVVGETINGVCWWCEASPMKEKWIKFRESFPSRTKCNKCGEALTVHQMANKFYYDAWSGIYHLCCDAGLSQADKYKRENISGEDMLRFLAQRRDL